MEKLEASGFSFIQSFLVSKENWNYLIETEIGIKSPNALLMETYDRQNYFIKKSFTTSKRMDDKQSNTIRNSTISNDARKTWI